MQTLYPTLIYRHRRENVKKCSLRGLEGDSRFAFYSYPKQQLPGLEQYISLELGAPPLTAADADCGLLLIDATWRYAAVMTKQIAPQLSQAIKRSIPAAFRTAYPRRQDDCAEPELGLASVEALYIAYKILGWPADRILDNYHWREEFLEINRKYL